MVYLRNNIPTFDHHEFIESFLQNRKTDCILYSREGTKYDVHKEILFPTILMKNILSTDSNIGCCQNLEIFCPCPAKELESMLKLLYGGSIFYNSEQNVSDIVKNLTKLFGFAEGLFSEDTYLELKEEKFETKPPMESEENFDIIQDPFNSIPNVNDSNNSEGCIPPESFLPLNKSIITDTNYHIEDSKDMISVDRSIKMEHISSVHEKKNIQRCTICYRMFHNQSNLSRHRSKTHKYQCNTCDAKFIKDTHLRNHISNFHLPQNQMEDNSSRCASCYACHRSLR